MNKIPSQLILAVAIFGAVSFKSLEPSMSLGSLVSKYQSSDDGYYAPIVDPGDQRGYVCLLKIDQRDTLPSSAYVLYGSSTTIAACKQSYNSIAQQISPNLLRENNLPAFLN